MSLLSAAIDTEVCDLIHSYFHFHIDVQKKPPRTVSHTPPFTLNQVRVPLECRVTILDSRDERLRTYCLTANCKTEYVSVDRDIWTRPNADCLFIPADDRIMVLKTFDHCGRKIMLHPSSLGEQPHRQILDMREAFDAHRLDLKMVPGRRLKNNEAIIHAILNNHSLVSRTMVRQGPYTATIEYPIKTINCSQRDGYYQTDTGPILVPNLDCEPDDMLSNLSLAFIAHAAPDWAECILRKPCPIDDSGVYVEHYCESLRLEGIRNEVIQCD